MVRKRQELSRAPRPKSPGRILSARSSHRFIVRISYPSVHVVPLKSESSLDQSSRRARLRESSSPDPSWCQPTGRTVGYSSCLWPAEKRVTFSRRWSTKVVLKEQLL